MRIYETAYKAGRTFEKFLEGVEENRELWHSIASRARAPAEAAEALAGFSGGWRLLALADDWCGDAVNILPVVARLVETVDDLELRIVGREEHPGLMDRHLTGESRSIPVFVLLDQEGRCRGWWGPRPRELQAWFEEEGRRLPKDERYRELRTWYARDRGRAIGEEIVELVQCGLSEDAVPYRGTRPCASLEAA